MYANQTRDTNEFLKSLAHSRRLEQASRIVPLRPGMKVFDYGCGDGAFFGHLANYCAAEDLYGFDPWLLDQMTFEGATTFASVPDFIGRLAGQFDVVYCIEVCEHLSDAENGIVFSNMKTLGKPGAAFVFGVPIEIGVSALLKNAYRFWKDRRQGVTAASLWRTTLSLPVGREWNDQGWCGSHIGFDHRRFREKLVSAGFRIERTACLPLWATGTLLNNEVYFVCRV